MNNKELSNEKIILFRILGNDLFPRHVENQTLNNLEWILNNEVSLESADKRFVLNRIVREEKKEKIIAMLEDHEAPYIDIPFVKEDYERITHKAEKVKYVTNLNYARNFCIVQGMDSGYTHILPFDGNCFFRNDGWKDLLSQVRANIESPYFYVFMWRVKTYDEVLNGEAQYYESHIDNGNIIIGLTEPQLIFTPKSDVLFNEDYVYGNASKAELLWKLGIPGPWDYWDIKSKNIALQNKSQYYSKIGAAGYTCRLPSGNAIADSNIVTRGAMRQRGIDNILCEIECLLRL